MENTGSNSDSSLRQITSEFEVPIYYEDTDFSGYVYHANYLKFFERAREEMFGMEFLKEQFEKGFHYVIARIEMDYKAPAKHADKLFIKSTAEYGRSVKVKFHQTAYLESTAGKELVDAQLLLVSVNDQGRPTKPTPEVLAYFDHLRTSPKGPTC